MFESLKMMGLGFVLQYDSGALEWGNVRDVVRMVEAGDLLRKLLRLQIARTNSR